MFNSMLTYSPQPWNRAKNCRILLSMDVPCSCGSKGPAWCYSDSKDVKGLSTQSYGFSSSHVWMWELDHKEGWAQKNWCFWTVVWRRLLRVPWTARRSNQLILKEISPEHSLEGLVLKCQYFGHLMWRTDSLEKTLMLGKTEGRRRRGWRRMRWLDGIITDLIDISLNKLWELVMACCSSWGCKESDTTEQPNWTAMLSHLFFLSTPAWEPRLSFSPLNRLRERNITKHILCGTEKSKVSKPLISECVPLASPSA